MRLNVVVGCAMAYTSPHGRRVDSYHVGSATKKNSPLPQNYWSQCTILALFSDFLRARRLRPCAKSQSCGKALHAVTKS